jgi:hypothetical protein
VAATKNIIASLDLEDRQHGHQTQYLQRALREHESRSRGISQNYAARLLAILREYIEIALTLQETSMSVLTVFDEPMSTLFDGLPVGGSRLL